MIFFCFIFCLQKHEVSLSHIESRPSVRDEGDYEFLVEFCAGEYGDVKGTLEEIKKQSTYCKIISREETEGNNETSNFPAELCFVSLSKTLHAKPLNCIQEDFVRYILQSP